MTQNPRKTALVIAPLLTAACVALITTGCENSDGDSVNTMHQVTEPTSDLKVLPFSDVEWGALNPARGDAGPRAADLWGARAATDATGFLVRFAEGFSSPPHTHNTTYRGIVIEGLVHNDDPDAAESWMPPGSYWTQPAGEVHITSAKGQGRVAYIEIQHGPYLVMPPEEASDNGERAINVHAANLVWLDASTSRLISLASGIAPDDGPRVAFLWGDPQDNSPGGSMIELPAGYSSTVSTSEGALRIVVIAGDVQLHRTQTSAHETLTPGSFVGATGADGGSITLSTFETAWLYVRSAGPVEIAAVPIR